MTSEENKRYNEVKRQAARQTHEWIVQEPDRFKAVAREILDLHNENEARYQQSLKDKQPYEELFDPLLYIIAEQQANPCPIIGHKSKPIPSDPEKAILIYYAALLALHESMNGYAHITDEIWPKHNPLEIMTRPEDCFKDHWGDKSLFIEAALLAVKNDMATMAISGGDMGDNLQGADWNSADGKKSILEYIHKLLSSDRKMKKAKAIKEAMIFFSLPSDYERRIRTEYDRHENEQKVNKTERKKGRK